MRRRVTRQLLPVRICALAVGAAAAVLGIAAPSAATPASAASTVPPALHVSGNHLVSSTGQRVTLRGVDMSGTEFVCAQNWSSDPFGGQPEDSAQTFAAMRSWNVNVVRIPLNEDCWLGINGVEVGGSAYRSAIIQLVDGLNAAGLYVILDLHWSAPGSQRALSQNPAPDEDHSPAFWTSVAQTFKGDPGVLFDLYNEPYFYWLTSGENQWQVLWQGGTITQYVTGGSPYTVSQNWTSAGFDQLTQDIRAAGASNVIMAGCVDWANDCSQWASSFSRWGSGDPNTVVSWHNYTAEGCSTVSCWDSVEAPLAAEYPIVTGETGDNASGSTPFLDSFLPWATTHGISVLAWTWNAWGDSANVLVTNMQTGAPTSGEGVTFRSWLLSFAGTLPAPSPTPTPTAAPTVAPTASPTPSPTPSPGTVAAPTPAPTPSGGASPTSASTPASAAGASPGSSAQPSTSPRPRAGAGSGDGPSSSEHPDGHRSQHSSRASRSTAAGAVGSGSSSRSGPAPLRADLVASTKPGTPPGIALAALIAAVVVAATLALGFGVPLSRRRLRFLHGVRLGRGRARP